MKEKRKITFWELFGVWFCVALTLGVINGFFIKIPILHNLILSSLGVILLIFPIYPVNMLAKWTEKQCRIFIRILAVIEIFLSFATVMVF